MSETCACAVIGAGVFGAWTAYELLRAGNSVTLFDAHGPANSRASSGGESRIIRMSYAADEIYTRWSQWSLARWREFLAQANVPHLFQQTGVLWTAPANDARVVDNRRSLENCSVRFEELTQSQLDRRFPQFRWDSPRVGVFEPDSGVLLARRAVQAVVRQFVNDGGTYWHGEVEAQAGHIRLRNGGPIQADVFVFACGPWLPALFPQLLRSVIYPTRQEVFFFGPAPGDRLFAPPHMPAWLDYTDARGGYSIPDLEGGGFKLAFDTHGVDFDPETGSRLVTAASAEFARTFLADRFPALRHAPLLETRVCQYENTANGDFLIDRHPGFDNVWLVGGGSGHGFKHGPAVGNHVANLIAGKANPEPRFSLVSKPATRSRSVY